MSEDSIKGKIFEEEIPTSSKLAFGGISFTSGFFSSLVIATSFTYFYNVKLGLAESFTGLAWLIFIAWNAINDPLLGFFQDRTKLEKYGRRIPYIRFGAPLYSFLFILSWFPIFVGSQLALFFNLLFMLYTFDTLYTMIGLISYSLPAEMAITQESRSNLMVFGAIGSAFSMLLSFVIPAILLTGDEPLEVDPLIPIFRITMIIFGIIGGIIMFVSSYYIKENKYAMMEEPLNFKESIIETFKNKPFVIFEISNFIFLTAQFILTNGVLYYVDFVLDLKGIMAMVPLILFFLMVFLFFPVYSKMVKIWGLKKTFIFCLLFTSAAFIIGFIIGWNFAPAIVAMILMGAGLSGYFLTNQMIMADIIDNDEILTGKRRETSYAGMNALITKPTNSIAPWLFLTIIGAFGFINEPEASQPESAEIGIMIAFTLIPAILILISAAIMYFYPLAGSEWKSKKEELHEIHQKKEEEYLKKLEK
ncbi:MAG: putative symporter YjmB [Promethearchaeota archaeon]|nr:MAG: putative symporter YjmB [Candidatus Lokiarchaeota archaeon]